MRTFKLVGLEMDVCVAMTIMITSQERLSIRTELNVKEAEKGVAEQGCTSEL